jgi:putative membrane protein
MAYYWFKTFHIIGVVVWFAAMFYLPRLFVYHAQARSENDIAREILENQFKIMEQRLYRIIMIPGMIVTVGTAIGLIVLMPEYLKQGWMHAKLTGVIALLVYHFYCGKLLKALAEGKCAWSGQQFRYFNELPTLLLITIVMLVVFKTAFPTDASVWLMIGLSILMVIAIQMYAKKRKMQAQLALINPPKS